eukprot:PITA_09543
MDKVVEEYEDIFTSPTRVPLDYQVKHSIDLTPGVPLPNGSIYLHFFMESYEIKRHIQELLRKAKIQVIPDWPSPTTLTELYNFLGLANFYSKFMLGFSHITWPLSQATKGGAKEKFFWYEPQQKAFIQLKHHLYSAPMLALPDLQQPFEIETNAFEYAIWVVLTQQMHRVAYHNETLSHIV